MTAFASLAAPARAAFAFWALLLCLGCLGSGALSAVNRRYGLTALAAALLAPVYLLWQVIFDLSLFGLTERSVALSRVLGVLPWLCWLAALVLLSLAAAQLLQYDITYSKTRLTPGAVKLFLDGMPCGVCCWRENGRVLFSNDCMNRLCLALTDGPLLNGNQFRDAIGDELRTVDGRVWRFACREFESEGETLRELIAADVTAEYAKTRSLERDKAELSALNQELRDYYNSMGEAVRHHEILRAKANIHDEMNRLMLATAAADGGDPAELDRIFALWGQNALPVCMQAGENADAEAGERLEKLAAALKLRLIWQGTSPAALPEPQRGLFWSAAQEAAVNAVKHAGARTLTISIFETDAAIRCEFANDGAAPEGPVRFTGGLANLSRLAERQGAAVKAQAANGTFTLSLCFPKEEL